MPATVRKIERPSEDPQLAIKLTLKMVRSAFSILRENGIFARMNFKCCMSCATAAVPKDRPSVYFHNQDAEHFNRGGKPLCIRFCTPDGKRIKTLANTAIRVFKSAGLTVVWDGDTNHIIEVSS